MKYELTIFKNQFDNKTHRHLTLDSWSNFVDLLGGLSQKRGQKGGGNNSSPLISPAVYTKGTTRSNKNVVRWGGWAAVDVDDYIMDSAVSELGLEKEIRSRFSHWDFVCYSTASSTVEKPKFRLVFRLDQHVPAEKIRHFWHALNTELGEIGDAQTKDLSRMYYVPAIYPNAHNFIFAQTTDKPIVVESLLQKHPYVEKTGNSFLDRLPPELQNAVIEHRKNSLHNTNIRWTSYHDCPFWPRMLAVEYRNISSTGWYHKMYQIMVALAGNAVKCGYPITAHQIAELCRQFDKETGNWYEGRPIEREADGALEYVYRNG
jgi:hypothetical protein